MKKVYAVNRGSYSDYGVIAIFSTKELAEEFMAAVPDDEYKDVEEYELDNNAADLIKRGFSLWTVHMLRNGDVEKTFRQKLFAYILTQRTHHIWQRTKAPAYMGKGIPDCLVSTVLAKSEEHAVKIANEHRARMIAMGEWA